MKMIGIIRYEWYIWNLLFFYKKNFYILALISVICNKLLKRVNYEKERKSKDVDNNIKEINGII